MKKILFITLAAACAVGTASAQETKVAIGISGWTGFAPLTLAKEAGLFKKHGLDVTLRKIPQWAALPWGVSGYLQSQHIPAKLNWLASVDHLLRNIREERLTIVILGDLLKGWGHAKVLYGYEPAGPQPQQGFYFVDPGYPKEYSRPHQPLGVFWQDENEFKQQWNSLFRILIEITA